MSPPGGAIDGLQDRHILSVGLQELPLRSVHRLVEIGNRAGALLGRTDESVAYFADDLIAKNNLTRNDLKNIAAGSAVTDNFRELISVYYTLANEYRLKTFNIIKEIGPLHEPRYRLSLEIIFELYQMVFERINIRKGKFTSGELNPTPEETKERVYNTILNLSSSLPEN